MCMGETMKTGTRQAVIGIRISEPIFQVVNGTSMDHVRKVSPNVSSGQFLKITLADHWPCRRNWKAEHKKIP